MPVSDALLTYAPVLGIGAVVMIALFIIIRQAGSSKSAGRAEATETPGDASAAFDYDSWRVQITDFLSVIERTMPHPLIEAIASRTSGIEVLGELLERAPDTSTNPDQHLVDLLLSRGRLSPTLRTLTWCRLLSELHSDPSLQAISDRANRLFDTIQKACIRANIRLDNLSLFSALSASLSEVSKQIATDRDHWSSVPEISELALQKADLFGPSANQMVVDVLTWGYKIEGEPSLISTVVIYNSVEW